MAYYNTNNEAGPTLSASSARAARQNDAVLEVFRGRPDALLAPHDVCEALGGRWPLTSVRRAMTTLTDEGRLEKTGHMRLGTFGKRVHTWRFAR